MALALGSIMALSALGQVQTRSLAPTPRLNQEAVASPKLKATKIAKPHRAKRGKRRSYHRRPASQVKRAGHPARRAHGRRGK
ncbi:MAG: hypothetical protein HYR64_02540 [Fimbriimonas ginsengisoli]|uniref:Uncharacterized protein n=1 Tax=Fimbriimonas ginsengisoli TaxID=1005039 RepID=A0A931PTY4_FIMGI|nr:hypothetical protein [Fimbriimonas ginsengisoli]